MNNLDNNQDELFLKAAQLVALMCRVDKIPDRLEGGITKRLIRKARVHYLGTDKIQWKNRLRSSDDLAELRGRPHRPRPIPPVSCDLNAYKHV